MPKLTKAKAFKIVFDELDKVDMFKGKYDARHGSDEFMSGVHAVMKAIAFGVSEDLGWQYEDIFLANWLGSKERASQNYCDDCIYMLDCEDKDLFWACRNKKSLYEPKTEQTEPSTEEFIQGMKNLQMEVKQTEPKERFIVVKDGKPTVMHRKTDSTIKDLVDAVADEVTYEDLITGEAEARGYVEGFKDGLEAKHTEKEEE